MKTIILSGIVAITLFITGCGAEKEALETAKNNMSKGAEKGITVTVPYTETKTAMQQWKEKMESLAENVYMHKAEIYADNARIPGIQDGTIDLLSTFSEAQNGDVQVNTKIDLGGALLSQTAHATKYQDASAFLKNLAAAISKVSLEESQKEADKELKKLEKQEEALNKEIKQNQQELKTLQEKLKMERQRNEELRKQLKDM